MTTERAERTFESLLPELHGAYQGWKEFELLKNAAKESFFLLVDEAVADRGVRMTVVEISAPTEQSARERAERHWPGWLIDESRPHRVLSGIFEVIIREDPTYQPFSIEHDGIKYARTVSKGSVMLDEEWLAEEDPQLFTEVTFELPWGAVISLPIEQLPKETLARLQKYIYNDRPRVSLAAPRLVKTEE